jgi:hypothetical protein
LIIENKGVRDEGFRAKGRVWMLRTEKELGEDRVVFRADVAHGLRIANGRG